MASTIFTTLMLFLYFTPQAREVAHMRLGRYCPTAESAHEDLLSALESLHEKQESLTDSMQLLKDMLDSRRQYDNLCKQYNFQQLQQQYSSSNSSTAATAVQPYSLAQQQQYIGSSTWATAVQQQYGLAPQVLAPGTASTAEVTWGGGSKEGAALAPSEAVLEVLERELLLLEVKQHVMELQEEKMESDMRQTALDLGQVRCRTGGGHSGGPQDLGRTFWWSSGLGADILVVLRTWDGHFGGPHGLGADMLVVLRDLGRMFWCPSVYGLPLCSAMSPNLSFAVIPRKQCLVVLRNLRRTFW